MMGSVFAMQGIGQFAAAMIALIVTSGFKESLMTASSAAHCSGVCQLAVDKMWRVVIGFGAVPGCIALYYRLTIPETPRYTFDVARDVVQAGEDTKAYMDGKSVGHPDQVQRAAIMEESRSELEPPKASWADFWAHYSQWKHGKTLIGTAGSWFFLDVGVLSPSLPLPPKIHSNDCSFLRSRLEQLHHSHCDRLGRRYQHVPGLLQNRRR
jgi:PHS family inorganic phosphate transporter-like MFS transporter